LLSLAGFLLGKLAWFSLGTRQNTSKRYLPQGLEA